jgi:hypothetical protein
VKKYKKNHAKKYKKLRKKIQKNYVKKYKKLREKIQKKLREKIQKNYVKKYKKIYVKKIQFSFTGWTWSIASTLKLDPRLSTYLLEHLNLTFFFFNASELIVSVNVHS